MPKINQIVELSLDDGENYLYKSRVADISNDYIGIEIPIEKKTGNIKLIAEEHEIKVFYISNAQGQYSFDTKVIGIKDEQVPIILLEIPEGFQRKQRRSFLRVQVNLETSYRINNNPEDTWEIVKTSDISGGGIQIVLPLHIKINLEDEIYGWLVLPFKNGAIDHVRYKAKVVRIDKPEDKKVNLVSLEFININEVMRAKIIRYCYEKQVDLRRKGLEE